MIFRFLDYLEQERGLRERSLKDYRLNLVIFMRYASVLPLTYKDVATIIVKIKIERGWGDRTTYKLVVELSEYYKFLCREGIVKENPFKDGHQFKKMERHNIEYFDWDDPAFKKLFNNPHITIRLKTILHVLKSSGIRSSELCNLKSADVQGRWLNILEGKGGQRRAAPIDEETRMWLGIYMTGLREHYSGEWLFPREDFNGPIKSGSLWKMLSRLGKKTGMHLYPHKFRHSLAGHLISHGADLAVCAEVLGHKNIATTKIYTHFPRKTILEKYDDALKSM